MQRDNLCLKENPIFLNSGRAAVEDPFLGFKHIIHKF
jgi:hypothetical protein